MDGLARLMHHDPAAVEAFFGVRGHDWAGSHLSLGSTPSRSGNLNTLGGGACSPGAGLPAKQLGRPCCFGVQLARTIPVTALTSASPTPACCCLPQVAYLVKPMSALFSPTLLLKVLWLLARERLGLVPLPQPPQQAARAAGNTSATPPAVSAADKMGGHRQQERQPAQVEE